MERRIIAHAIPVTMDGCHILEQLRMSDNPVAGTDKKSSAVKEVPVSRKRAPDLSRLLSISAILVSLAVAGSFVLDEMMRFERAAQILPPAKSANAKDAVAQPAAVKVAPPDAAQDLSRVRSLEKRLALLERQIVLLQQQALTSQRRNSSFQAQLTSMEMQLDETDSIVVASVSKPAQAFVPTRTVVVAPDPTPAPTPVPAPATVKPAALTPIPEPVIGIDTHPEPTRVAVARDTESAPTRHTSSPEKTTPMSILTGSIPPEKNTDTTKSLEYDVAKLVKPSVRDAIPAKVSHTRFALSLALYDSVDGVKAAWGKLQKQRHAVLEDLEPRVLPQGTQDGKLMYRLLLGPISNAATAAKHCARLSVSGITCRPGLYGGEALETPPSPGTLIRVDVVADAAPEAPVLSAQLRALIAKPPLPQRKPKYRTSKAAK